MALRRQLQPIGEVARDMLIRRLLTEGWARVDIARLIGVTKQSLGYLIRHRRLDEPDIQSGMTLTDRQMIRLATTHGVTMVINSKAVLA